MVLFPGCNCCGGGDGGWACYECTPCLVVAFETAGTGDPANNTFHLGPYLTGHTAHAGRPYRFVEVGANCDGVDPDDPDGRYTWHGAGYVTPDGVIGDPWIDYDPETGIYTSSYPYRGYLRLQIGCDSPEGGDEYTAIYSEDCTDGVCVDESKICCGEYATAVENYWLDVVRNASWKPSFRVLTAGIDTDSDEPIEIGGSDGRQINWDASVGYSVPYRVYIENRPGFVIRAAADSNYQKPFTLRVQGCTNDVNLKGEQYKISFGHAETGTDDGPTKISHIDEYGNETVFTLTSGVYETLVGVLDNDKPSPFFTGTYIAEFADGKTSRIELRSSYQLIRVLKC